MNSPRSEAGRARTRWIPSNLVESLLVVVIVSVLAASAGVGIRVDPGFWGGRGAADAPSAKIELGGRNGR